ncbi:copper resistance protein CopC [Candidatus Protofrankia californiensis]|uniref:Copper resistance protein CopC n=1 Tax=Candidatus Protofrankia californiensis TaxID=1839754 RepID=A0A1C3PFY1_9ACTN|nr:copper resistance protein CopC [Candidatus Protofrankia californiensis]
MRTLIRLVGLVVTGLVLLVVMAGPASAHATLLFTGPAADGTVPDGPGALTLIFDQPVTVTGSSVRLFDADRRAVPTERAGVGDGGRSVTAAVDQRVGGGVYTVAWQVVAGDGDVMGGEYRFAVGPAASTLGNGQTSSATKGVGWVTVLRWLLFVALALYLGGLAGQRLARHRDETTPDSPRPWLLPGALAGLVTTLGLAALLVGDGSPIRGLARLTPAALLETGPGRLAAVQVAGFALAVLAVLARRAGWGAVPVGVVVVAEALRAHPQGRQPGSGALLTAVHLVAVAVWVGALVQVLRTLAVWRGRPGVGRVLLGAYARLALWLLALVVATGGLSALVLVPLNRVVTTGYGQLLLAKITLVVVAAVLALTARRHLRRAAAAHDGGPPRPARLEAGVLVGVLGLSGLLTAIPTPTDPKAPLPFAPPAAGPVVPAGTLAGQIGVAIRASDGQLVVQLSTPDATGEPAASQADYQMSAALADPDGPSRTLTLRGCGSGCFTAPVGWREGTSRLTLTAAADGWTGGRTSLAVAWPPRPDPDLLREAVTAMRQVGQFTLHERVTSDTSRGLGTPSALSLSGARFLDSEPYGSGQAPVTTRLDTTDGQTRLALAYPAESLQIELALAPDGKIIREVLAAPKHLITRSFVYPDHDAP